MRTAASRRASERAGRAAEVIALAWLTLKGFALLDRRARNSQGEIDLVMRRGKLLTFIEVKRRASADEAFGAVRPAAQERISRAADVWRASRSWARDCDVRFDVVIVTPWRTPIHVPDAWRPSPR